MPSIKELRKKSEDSRERRREHQRSRAEHRTAVKERLAVKRRDRIRYGTKGIPTSEGIKVAFGFWDASLKFHVLKPAEYVKKFKELTGNPPVHKLLLDAEGISKEDREYMLKQLGAQAHIVETAKQMIYREDDVVVDGVPVKPKAAEKPTGKKAAVKG